MIMQPRDWMDTLIAKASLNERIVARYFRIGINSDWGRTAAVKSLYTRINLS